MKQETAKNIKYPIIFQIETILGCNLKCPDCAIGADMIDRKKGRWTFDKFKNVMDNISSHCEYLYLHIWGEPMLNSDIISIIRYASKFTKTNISTHGNNITPSLGVELISSGLTDLVISIDGVTQEVYETYRIGGKVDKALSSLLMLQTYNQRQGFPVNIIPQFIVFKHNQHEMKLFRELCSDLNLVPTFRAPYLRTDSDNQLGSDPKLHRNVAKNTKDRQRIMAECECSYQVLTILLDGQVVACCNDHNGITDFGNIFEQSFMEVWDSPKYRKFRKDLRSGNAPNSCLETCLTY